MYLTTFAETAKWVISGYYVHVQMHDTCTETYDNSSELHQGKQNF